jgi:hypothetical protein
MPIMSPRPEDPPIRKRSPASLVTFEVKRVPSNVDARSYLALVVHLSDNTHKYVKFGLPCETGSLVTGLRELAEEIEMEYHK